MRRTVLPVLLGLAIGVIPLAPVEHVHKTAGPDGRDHVIAHTHNSAHHRFVQDWAHHPHASLDDEDSVILTLDMVLATPYVHVAVAPPAPLAVLIKEPEAAKRANAPLIEPLIHGPPRAPSALRGPPATSRL